jgi:hypothetical protein
MGPESSYLCLQKATIVPYPEANGSTHTNPPLFFKFNFNIIFLRFCKVSCTFKFSDENSVHISSLFHVSYMPCPITFQVQMKPFSENSALSTWLLV